jgi:hypothetical protein
MSDDTVLTFGFRAVCGKKVVAACDGGRISSDGGAMLPAAAERRIGIEATLGLDIRNVITNLTHGSAEWL